MTKSALQIARAAYQPKLPKALKGAVKVKEGEPTQSVADQEAIKALFPNTYGMPLIQFVEGEAVNMPAINVGDKAYAVDAFFIHVLNGIAATAAHADNLDDVLRQVYRFAKIYRTKLSFFHTPCVLRQQR